MKYIESCISSLPIQMGAEQVEEISTPDTSYNLAGHSSHVGKSRASFEVICRSLHALWFRKWGCEDRGAKVWPRSTPTESYVPSGIHCLCIYITASVVGCTIHLNLSCHPVEQSNVLHSELSLDKSLNKLCVFQLTCLSYISPTHRS